MLKNLLPTSLALTIITSLGLFFWIPSAQAAQPTGLTISPAILQLQIEAEQNQQNFNIDVTNHYDQPLQLQLSVQDFSQAQASSHPFFTEQKASELQTSPQASQWIQLPSETITIPSRKTMTVTSTIVNGAKLSPGGHYAALTATVISDQPNRVGINQSISSLIFLVKKGGQIYNLNLQKFELDKNWWGQALDATVTMSNQGNTHLTPRGQVQLKNPFGKTIARAIINPKSSILLPSGQANYQAVFTDQPVLWWPGNYSLSVSYRYDQQSQITSHNQSIFSFGLITLAAILILIILALTIVVMRQKNRANH